MPCAVGRLAWAVDPMRDIAPRLLLENCRARLPAGNVVRALQRNQPDAWKRWATGEAVLFAPQSWRFPELVLEASVGLHGQRGMVRLAWTGGGAQRLELVATPSQVGGMRWLWLCPRLERYAAHLYLPPDAAGFASRQAHSLDYAGKRLNTADRAKRRAARLRELLGQRPPILGTLLPPPPARMSARTYLQAVGVIEAAEGILGLRQPLTASAHVPPDIALSPGDQHW